jgi:hypothetical protein
VPDDSVGYDEWDVGCVVRPPLGRDGEPDRTGKQREPKPRHDRLPVHYCREWRAVKLARWDEPRPGVVVDDENGRRHG